MPLSQLEAITGRRIRPNYTSLLNSQLGYLPAIKAREDALRHQQTMEEQAQQRIRLESKIAKQQRQDASKARTLGYVGLGVNTGLAAAPYLSDVFDSAKDTASFIPSSGYGPIGTPGYGGQMSGPWEQSSFVSKVSDVPVLGGIAQAGQKLYNLGAESLGDIGSFFSDLFS